jgi:hypothetical protein
MMCGINVNSSSLNHTHISGKLLAPAALIQGNNLVPIKRRIDGHEKWRHLWYKVFVFNSALILQV